MSAWLACDPVSIPVQRHRCHPTHLRSSTRSFDGILGTAKSTLSEQKQLTVPESLAANGLASAQVGFKLGRVRDGKNDGQATFGGVE